MYNQKIDSSIGFLFSHANLTLLRQINRNFHSAGFDITIEQMSLLSCLFFEDGKTQKELSEKNLKDKVSITKVVDSLVKRKLVKRVTDKNDRRLKRIYITKKGSEVIPNLRKIILKTLREAFKGINKKDIEVFKSVLSSINKNLTDTDLLEFINSNKGRWN